MYILVPTQGKEIVEDILNKSYISHKSVDIQGFLPEPLTHIAIMGITPYESALIVGLRHKADLLIIDFGKEAIAYVGGDLFLTAEHIDTIHQHIDAIVEKYYHVTLEKKLGL